MRPLLAVILLAALWLLPACDGANRSLTAPTSTAWAAQSQAASVIVSGTVHDTNATPLDGAIVRSGSAQVTTDASGAFSVSVLRGGNLHFEKDGYESRDAGVNFTAPATPVEVFMQRVHVLGELDQLSLTLTPHDSPYYVGEPYESDYCRPCLRVRLRAGAGRDVNVTLRWPSSANVAMWQGETKCAADGPATCTMRVKGAVLDTIFYVGLPLENRQPQTLLQPLALELTSRP